MSDKYSLSDYSFTELKKLAKDMGLESRRSKKEYISDITSAFQEYEEYKSNKVDKYTKLKQLGSRGKEGTTYLVVDKKQREFAMKVFRKTKSSTTLKNEYYLQKKAATTGIAPRVVEHDTVSKYIVMEKLDTHLIDIMKKQKGSLYKYQQEQIINIFKKLDEVGVFHGDSNIMNYMFKEKNGEKKLYIIDFGFAKEITPRLIKKLGTETPNIRIMTLGFILKLKELKCPSSSWKYLQKYISQEEIDKFNL